MPGSESTAVLLAAALSLPLHKYIEIHLKSKFLAPTVLAVSSKLVLLLVFLSLVYIGFLLFFLFPLSSFLVFLPGLCFAI